MIAETLPKVVGSAMTIRPRLSALREITGIEVTGFKSAADTVHVNFRNITIFAGANSAGKSTIMQPLLMIKQTIETPFDPGGLSIGGPLARFTHADQFFSHTSLKTSGDVFSIGFWQGTHKTTLSYGRASSGIIDVMEMSFGSRGKSHTWRPGEVLTEDSPSLKYIEDQKIYGNIYPRQYFNDLFKNFQLKILPDRSFLIVNLLRKDDDAAISRGRSIFASPANSLSEQVRKLIYLPGLRGNPERNYVISAAGPEFPGSFNDYVASIIHYWVVSKDEKLKILQKNLKDLGLTWRVTTKSVDDTRVEVRVGRLPNAAQGGAKDTVNIADVGFGVSQTLPVLVALLSAEPGRMVFVEQPELHLHPKAQVALADIILQAADRGVRVIIETHSSLLILALQTVVAEGRISPDRISMNWFSRDNTGQTRVIEATLGNDGSYGEWPADFDTIELALQDKYMSVVERRRAEG